MRANDDALADFFTQISMGQIVLPRFQRHEAWSRGQIVGVIRNILRNPSLPIGALLTLRIGDEEPFHSREVVGAPPKAERPTTHLLDGQQRMTALWRSLNADYNDMRLFVFLDETGKEDEPEVEIVRVRTRNGVMQPVWAHDKSQLIERGFIPLELLRPGADGEKEADDWCDAIEESTDRRSMEKLINRLRQRVANYRIPYLELPIGTDREIALDVFINMNTSGTALKDFDIVVAQLESAAERSLHDMMEELHADVPSLKDYRKPEDLALSVGALLMDQPPLKKTYLDKDFGGNLHQAWPEVRRGIARGIDFLHDEAVYSERLVPTDVAVYLICALWGTLSDDGVDAEGRARVMMRKALWRASFTDRYLKTAATRGYADFRRLKQLIAGTDGAEVPPLFDEEANPLPSSDELIRASWPGKRDRLARAVLCASLRSGGIDFAAGTPASANSVIGRELHHLFPIYVLDSDRGDEHVNRALNCALINWKTNRKIAAKTPADYIKARADQAELGEGEVRRRLESHIIPYDSLIAGDYEAFLKQRAEDVHSAMVRLCEGQS